MSMILVLLSKVALLCRSWGGGRCLSAGSCWSDRRFLVWTSRQGDVPIFHVSIKFRQEWSRMFVRPTYLDPLLVSNLRHGTCV